MSDVHVAVGALLMPAFGALAVGAGLLSWFRASPHIAQLARRALLAVGVAVAAIGAALALRGSAPDEWLHWLYGALLLAVMLAPAALTHPSTDRRLESLSVAVAAAVAAVLAWRLGASG
jgi:hypothetical protein